MSNSLLIIFGLGLFISSSVLVWAFYHYALKRGLLAIPNERSSHKVPTPQGAGVVFVLLWLLCLLVGYAFKLFSLMDLLLFFPTTLLVSLVGFWDDHREITARKRLIAQLLAVGFCVIILGDFSSLHLSRYTTFYMGWAGLALIVLGIVGSINLYNFMDGIDGLAAVEAIFVFGIGGFLFWQAGAMPLALLTWAIVFLVAGFLVWNWPKADVFMGDVGSYFLGFLVGLFAFVGDRLYAIPITVWIILYSGFWFDASVTLFRRLVRRENLALPHREQAIHRLYDYRLQKTGYSKSGILWGAIILNVILGAIAIWSFKTDSFKWGVGLMLVILTSVYLKIETLKPMTKKIKNSKQDIL